jgi:hypothetical protein
MDSEIKMDQPILLSEKTFLFSEFFSRQNFFWFFGKGGNLFEQKKNFGGKKIY